MAMNYQEALTQRLKGQPYEVGGITGGIQAAPVQAPGLAPEAPVLPAAQPAAAPKSPFQFNQGSVRSILDKYEHTPAGLQKAFAENADLAGASKIGGSKGDKILDPSTGRWIDVIQAAGEGGKAWQWLDDEGTARPQAQAGGFGGLFGGSGISPMLQGDPSSGIQQALQNIGGLNDTSRLQQLIAALGGK